MKEDLSRKEITRCIGNGFEVYMEYRVGLGWKNMEKKHTFLAFSGDLYRYTLPEPNLYRYRCGIGAVHPALF